MAESAFIVVVPEVEDRVRSLRLRFDPVAKLGVPAHVTVLYPFMDPKLIDSVVISRAAEAIASIPAFEFSLERVERFPGVVYLAPEPSASFVRLTDALVSRFPDFHPYSGRFGQVIPHLTVAHGSEEELAEVCALLSTATDSNKRITSVCRSVLLIESSSGVWRDVHTYVLSNEPTREDTLANSQ